jgi:hypothetical protein
MENNLTDHSENCKYLGFDCWDCGHLDNAVTCDCHICNPPKQSKKFTDFFEPKTFAPGETKKIKNRSSEKYKPSYITCWIQIRLVDEGRYKSVHYRPNGELIKFIEQNMLAIAYDTIHFEIIVKADKTVSLYACYNLIIGSRHIADLDINDDYVKKFIEM